MMPNASLFIFFNYLTKLDLAWYLGEGEKLDDLLDNFSDWLQFSGYSLPIDGPLTITCYRGNLLRPDEKVVGFETAELEMFDRAIREGMTEGDWRSLGTALLASPGMSENRAWQMELLLEQWKREFREMIRSWRWDEIKSEALENDQDGSGYSLLGTVFDLMPSGKYYMPWACSNVTEGEARKDEVWQEVLEDVANEHGMWIENGEGDPCDIFAVCEVEQTEEEVEDENDW